MELKSVTLPASSAVPYPLAETTLTPSTRPTTPTTSRLKPWALGEGVRMYRSASVPVESTSLNEALSEAANTATAATRVRPITSAMAVEAVRIGFRMAFCCARSPGSPRPRSGAPIAAAIGRTISGARAVTPKTTPTTPTTMKHPQLGEPGGRLPGWPPLEAALHSTSSVAVLTAGSRELFPSWVVNFRLLTSGG
jgi:hypothetical protein